MTRPDDPIRGVLVIFAKQERAEYLHLLIDAVTLI